MANDIDNDFVACCRKCTDSQLKNVLIDEYSAFNHRDYASACIAAAERGWRMHRGERIS
jgi:hypothetical protein